MSRWWMNPGVGAYQPSWQRGSRNSSITRMVSRRNLVVEIELGAVEQGPEDVGVGFFLVGGGAAALQVGHELVDLGGGGAAIEADHVQLVDVPCVVGRHEDRRLEGRPGRRGESQTVDVRKRYHDFVR